METRTFQHFMVEAERLLDGEAKRKGYSPNGPDGPNRLYEFIQQNIAQGHGHALGEIVYKAQRFSATGDVNDLYKIVAWAFLIYRHAKS